MSISARPNPVINCPLTATWAAIGGKWKLTIVHLLAREPRHFAELRRRLDAVSDGVSQKVLSQQLRDLMADGIVARQSSGRSPSPVIYSLTEYGRTALPLLDLVRRWGEVHLMRTGSAREVLSCAVVSNPERRPIED